MAKWHLEQFVRLLLESLDKNSIEFQRVLVYFIRALREMEEKGIFYLKTMKNGKRRIFKKVYCCKTVEDWKKCPEYHCPAWPCNEDSEYKCPHYSNEVPIELKPDEIITIDE